MLRVHKLLLGLALLAAGPAIANQPTGTLRDFLVEYRCPVVDRLERVYEAGDTATHVDRFLAVTVPEHPHGYVQCMFLDNRTRILCEASSGYHFDPPDQPRSLYLSKEAIDALAALEFNTDDSKGNFQAFGQLKQPVNLNDIADFMLETLHNVYGARATSRLRFNAPYAPRPTTKCVPVS
jgi:hypothetical protein